MMTMAEDSGFEVDALNGEPGIYSARYLREDATYAERFDDIYRRMRERGTDNRRARFVCALAVAERYRCHVRNHRDASTVASPTLPPDRTASATTRFFSIRPTARRSARSSDERKNRGQPPRPGDAGISRLSDAPHAPEIFRRVACMPAAMAAIDNQFLLD